MEWSALLMVFVMDGAEAEDQQVGSWERREDQQEAKVEGKKEVSFYGVPVKCAVDHILFPATVIPAALASSSVSQPHCRDVEAEAGGGPSDSSGTVHQKVSQQASCPSLIPEPVRPLLSREAVPGADWHRLWRTWKSLLAVHSRLTRHPLPGSCCGDARAQGSMGKAWI